MCSSPGRTFYDYVFCVHRWDNCVWVRAVHIGFQQYVMPISYHRDFKTHEEHADLYTASHAALLLSLELGIPVQLSLPRA